VSSKRNKATTCFIDFSPDLKINMIPAGDELLKA